MIGKIREENIMEKINTLCTELEVILNDVSSKGINEIDETTVVEKLEALSIKANKLRMEKGAALIKGFITGYRKYKEGKIEIKQIAKKLMAMNFYVKNIIDYEDRSEL
jgi:hypothetical protein